MIEGDYQEMGTEAYIELFCLNPQNGPAGPQKLLSCETYQFCKFSRSWEFQRQGLEVGRLASNLLLPGILSTSSCLPGWYGFQFKSFLGLVLSRKRTCDKLREMKSVHSRLAQA
jgi:hypothetical protein